jgi:ABC-type multidrug transport system fused ATPase/permease subunit
MSRASLSDSVGPKSDFWSNLTTQPLTNHHPPQSTLTLLLGIWGHFRRIRRIQLGLLLVVMLASGMAEFLSLGAALPFLAVLTDPQRLWQQPLVQELAIRVSITSASQLLLPATVTFAFAVVLAMIIRLANLWLNSRLAAAVGSDLSCEAYRRTLYQPYLVHVQRNSAEVITGITTEIAYTVVALNKLLQLITAVVVSASLLAGLLLIDMSVALGAAALFGAAYSALAITARRQLRSNGLKIVEASSQQLKTLQEGLGAIRDVLLDGCQSIYLQNYQQADRLQRKLQAKNYFLGSFPRYPLEALGMLSIAFLGAGLVFQNGNGAAALPLLGSLALGAQRLLPALQQVYSAWADLKSYNAPLEGVLATLNQPLPLQIIGSEFLPLFQVIRLQDVHFRYGQDQPDVLQGLHLEIRRGDRIGLIGTTGSGKSTTLDLVMGLLIPTTGKVLVDGVDLHDPEYPERLVGWRSSIAHVPQNIYLTDGSIAENIAFGVPRQKIDLSRVKQAAEQAQIASFVETSAHGYETFVGERGIRLSGGQRQRIAIARALYKQARLLVFDEATSALDNGTEQAVMAAIEGLTKDLTIVIIAHRLSTVQRCDRVIRLAKGSVSADGPPSLVL